MAGTKKFDNFDSTVEWFGNVDWGLGLPFPVVMVVLAAGIEVLGAFCLLTGFAVRLVAIPLMVTMVVAAYTVHWKNGWLAIAEGGGFFATERTIAAVDRLSRGRSILQEYGNYSWLTENGSFVILNNGNEFAATYFIMLLVLFFYGSGRYVSVDFWLHRKLVNSEQ